MRRRDAIAVIGAALGLSGCWGSDTYTWNQKLTVMVQTPEGVKTGSAVTKVTISVGDGGLNGHVINQTFAGEATVVDLGGGRLLFALLSNTSTWQAMTANQAEFTFRDQLPKDDIKKSESDNLRAKYSFLQTLRGARTMPSGSVPLLVAFGDINDPKTVKEVKPGKLTDVFGAGYSLKSITLEITDESETEGEVEKVLGWITSHETGLIPTKMKPANEYKPEEELSPFNFFRKGKKIWPCRKSLCSQYFPWKKGDATLYFTRQPC